MKVHYINIWLFALPLNILVSSPKKNSSIAQKRPTTRLLCECELYSPANYNNDPQMKYVIDNFNKQTQQRLHEYDDRMIEKRKQCKDQCDKEIQKIILKDKLEKQMEQQLTTLETKINTDDIPTCFCEKSMADKAEKFCLNCGKNMGAVSPAWCLLSGLGYAGWTHYVATTVAEAATNAEKLTAVIFKEISSIDDFTKVTKFANIIQQELRATCAATSSSTGANQATSTYICSIVQKGSTPSTVENFVSKALETIVDKAPQAAEATEIAEAAKYTSTTSSLTTGIIASIIAIVIIVLIMVIIYLILHYRRKKKMKKKLQYIKLLEE
ncbi:PIR protein, putative [Plasmodium sp. gorilla clade G1]|nr:PIR protein, putative [Plasmodium sp. gorilla clade G1]